jgi:putative salt-induced outer membrane protein YdiY
VKNFTRLGKFIVFIWALAAILSIAYFASKAFAGEYKTSLEFTLDARTGNTDSQDYKIGGDLRYVSDRSEQKLYGDLLYGETEKKKTKGSWELGFKNMNKLEDPLYIYQDAKLEADEFKGYNYLISFNGGLGAVNDYSDHVIKAEIGPGFIYEDQDIIDKGYPSARGYLSYKYNFSHRMSSSSSFEHIRDLENDNNYRHKWLVSSSVGLTEGLLLKAERELEYINAPAKGRSMHNWLNSITLVVNY